MNAQTEQIQQDIERTRADLDDTLSAIEQRLAPSQLVEDGLDYLRHHGAREYISNLGTAAKQDPLPLALVGVGLAWLMMSGSRARSRYDAVPDDAGTAEAGAKLRAVAANVKDTAAQASHKITDIAQGARERARQAGDAARHGAERVRSGYAHMLDEQPLAIGAIGLALGAALGAAAPRSRTEDRWIGDTSERVKEGLGQVGRERIEKIDQATRETVALDRQRSERESVSEADPQAVAGSPPYVPGAAPGKPV
jgi:hypothetical protein